MHHFCLLNPFCHLSLCDAKRNLLYSFKWCRREKKKVVSSKWSYTWQLKIHHLEMQGLKDIASYHSTKWPDLIIRDTKKPMNACTVFKTGFYYHLKYIHVYHCVMSPIISMTLLNCLGTEDNCRSFAKESVFALPENKTFSCSTVSGCCLVLFLRMWDTFLTGDAVYLDCRSHAVGLHTENEVWYRSAEYSSNLF